METIVIGPGELLIGFMTIVVIGISVLAIYLKRRLYDKGRQRS
jgi:hypothetical protein